MTKHEKGIYARLRAIAGIVCCLLFFYFPGKAQKRLPQIQHLGRTQSIIRVKEPTKFLLLPIEEGAPEAKVSLLADNKITQSHTIRLAQKQVDYYVPIDISPYASQTLAIQVCEVPEQAICWEHITLADQFDTTNRETFRPLYHFSPAYGWMNDPNGMVYKDGEYHLFYQYNPFGSMWGNMHWGHAISKDLVHWEHLPIAIAPDGWGTVFSGSCVVDTRNSAGFGENAIIAFYTSAGERQTQSLAYSLDNGRTFQKYEQNPILTSTEADFRDPKVFWHEASQKWIMVLAVGQEMQFYSSANLKEWNFESRFGEGQGVHAGVWECPDLIELPVQGSKQKKWVLLCNINPGGPSGGSATQYFVGSFNGKEFVNESPSKTKWMDYGKDHYATVTWSNAPHNRTIALAWMSNWEYANQVPTLQFRSANSIPRDLSLYNKHGETYLSSSPSPEVTSLRGKPSKKGSFKVNRPLEISSLLENNNGAYELELRFKSNQAKKIRFKLMNQEGEEVVFCYDLLERQFSMDRRQSGQTQFSKHFATTTQAPISAQQDYVLRLFVDRCSIEAFDGEGDFAMTNLVFPTKPYNRLFFENIDGEYKVSSLTIYPLR